MGAKLLNHAAAEEAIRECRAYAAYLTDLAEALRRHARQMEQYWQGESYNRFCEALTDLARRIDQAHAASAAAEKKLGAGLDRARDDERAEELKKQQGASAGNKRTP